NPSTPGVAPPAVAFMRGDEILGYLGTIPVNFWNGETEIPSHWLKGFMVLPEYQNGPVGAAVLKELLKHVELSGIMTVAVPARRLFSSVGYADCGVLPNYISTIRPARIARNLDVAALGLGLPSWLQRGTVLSQRMGVATLAGLLMGVGIAAWRFVRDGASELDVDIGGALPAADALDGLWLRSRATLRSAAVRNGAFLNWRYAPAAGSTYEAVAVRERGAGKRLVAIALVRRPNEVTDPRLKGIKVATLSDILFPTDQPAAGVAAISGAERIARRMGADALVCAASHPVLGAALRQRAAFRIPGNVHLMIRNIDGTPLLPTDRESWWATRGDASSDEVF
ncbi:MAG: hypothetical protein ACREOJ_11350, partial [Gemmatimonadaceae bacterium]